MHSILTSRLRRSLSLAALAAAGSSFVAPDAAACGGLFCNNATPVNQVAERIIFAVNGDDTVTAAIEIMYEGPAESFAWVLPVPAGEIEVGVSSAQALDSVDQQSNPSYRLNVSFDESCGVDSAQGPRVAQQGAVPTIAPATPEPGAPVPVVTVIASGNAGPYDWEQIMVDAMGEDPVELALQWLTDNDYEVTEDTAQALEPYLAQDFNLVAFRLTKQSTAGSVRPILITYPGDNASIPIIPTAVAASDDMGIKVWVLGDSRAVSTNFLNLELNEAAINWFNAGINYNDVVIAAANEAGGHGFVTEQSGPAEAFAQNIYPEWVEQSWDQLQNGQFRTAQDFFRTALQSFNGRDGVEDVFRDPDIISLREGATHDQFLNCMDCYFQENVPVRTNAYPETPYVPGEDPLDAFDAAEFLDAFENLVIAPLRDTQALFENSSSVTRFYTTLSPDEMTEDPIFDFNAELGDVSNQHVAEQVMLCGEDRDNEWEIELPQGLKVAGFGRTWPLTMQDEVPLNLRVLNMSTTGEGEVIEDNTEAIQRRLADLGIGGSQIPQPPGEDDPPAPPVEPPARPMQPPLPPTVDDDDGPAMVDDDDGAPPDDGADDDRGTNDASLTVGGCSVSAPTSQTPSSQAPWWALTGLGLLALRRRRRD